MKCEAKEFLQNVAQLRRKVRPELQELQTVAHVSSCAPL
eukprot:CAMPEP_0114628930 /NCGR_PEP_ID=MMETSP0168-20121206/13088_1 /TAXON_ID=95228 ORGANISM="Vannella sp., Strain DIVA3 517/6/12" /NCGR_SAMPLE_ID=MMETSP0168 /ASSEMBLY_ACC=CAM_ASM_000044 /LENGTH=38 /DNA_ID= /DNA_START= /DNA_END= /DNA_ORIENTATION=